MVSTGSIRILIVEDHPVFREGLAAIVELQQDMFLVAQAVNAAEAVSEFRVHQPDVTLMDLRLPGTNGTDVYSDSGRVSPRSNHHAATLRKRWGDSASIASRRRGLCLQEHPKNELLDVIRSVHAGRRHIPQQVAARFAEHLGEGDLTTRELDVLRLIRDGYRNKQIADQLAIAETTVNFHIKNFVDKLQANDRTHAVTIALRRGLLQI